MKQLKGTTYLFAALIGISIAATGCGGSGSNNNPNGTTGPVGIGGPIGAPGYAPGVITPGGGSIAFSDLNARDTGAAIIDYTPGFSAANFVPISGYAGGLTMNSVSLPGGQTGSLMGITQGGSTITVYTGPGNNQTCPFGINLCSNLTGTIAVSGNDASALGASGGLGQIQGLAISLTRSGSVISMGQAWICNYRDQMGQCHGLVLNFVPH